MHTIRHKHTHTNSISNPITEGVIWKQILFFFFPLLLSSFFQQLYNTADALIVGRVAGKEALSAVGGSAGSVLGIFMMFYIGFGGGAAVLAAQFFGAKRMDMLRETVRRSFLLSALLGLIGTVVCLGLAGPILAAMRTPADVLQPSLGYLRIVALGLAPNALYNMEASILRAMGDSRRPLFILIFTCLTNIGLDLLFVAALGMGAAGAGLATALCQLASAVLAFVSLWHSIRFYPNNQLEKKSGTDVSVETPVPASGEAGSAIGPRGSLSFRSNALTRRILRMGLPLGFSEVMYTLANAVLMTAVNGFGTDTVAAYAAYGKIDAIFWMIVGSFGIAITTFVGQNIGAGKWDRVMQSIRDCALMMFLSLGIVITVLYIFARPLQTLFCPDPAVVEIGVRMMRFLMPFYFLYIPIEVLFGALRGMGDSVVPTIITFFSVCILRSAWGLVAVPLHHTVNTVLMGFPVTWIVSDVAFLIYFSLYLRRNHFAALISRDSRQT